MAWPVSAAAQPPAAAAQAFVVRTAVTTAGPDASPADPWTPQRVDAAAEPAAPPAPTQAPQPALAPEPPRPMGPPIPPRDERGGGLLATGTATLGLTYLFTSLGGAITIDKADARLDGMLLDEGAREAAEHKKRFGRRLMVPVIGPFLALRHADSAKASWGAGFSGVLQASGAVMLAIGAIRYARYRKAMRLRMSAGPMLGGGAQITLQGRF